MGRPGTGGSGGGSFGGHSSGRTSGGHRVGGSGGGRPGTSGNSYRSSYSGMRSYRHYGPTFIRGGGYAGGPILPLLICLFILIATVSSNMGNAPKSTRNRERLDNPVAYTNQCVVDEIGWIENPARLSKNYKDFTKKPECSHTSYYMLMTVPWKRMQKNRSMQNSITKNILRTRERFCICISRAE